MRRRFERLRAMLKLNDAALVLAEVSPSPLQGQVAQECEQL
jgi:hypothetical protein